MDRRQALSALQKSTITTEVGGQLDPEQSKTFIQEVQDRSSFGSAIRLERRTAEKGKIERMGNGSRLMRGKEENADDGYRAGISTSEAEYQTSKLWLPFEVTEDFFHENIEGEAAEAKIIARMTSQFGLDLDDLNINGDETSEDAFISLDNGLLKLLATEATGANRVDATKVKDAEGTELRGAMDKALFFAAKYAMPDKYVNSGRLRWFMSPNRWTSWIEYLTNRATGAGDDALMAKALFPLGIPPFVGAASDENPTPMPGVPFFPDDRIVLADPQNFVRVVNWDVRSKRVTGETDWELATRDKRGYVFFIKPDFVIDQGEAVVDLHGLSEITVP